MELALEEIYKIEGVVDLVIELLEKYDFYTSSRENADLFKDELTELLLKKCICSYNDEEYDTFSPDDKDFTHNIS
jgi:hypothetical protein